MVPPTPSAMMCHDVPTVTRQWIVMIVDVNEVVVLSQVFFASHLFFLSSLVKLLNLFLNAEIM